MDAAVVETAVRRAGLVKADRREQEPEHGVQPFAVPGLLVRVPGFPGVRADHPVQHFHAGPDDGFRLPFVNPVALIPLKARAWLDLTERQKKGEKVDGKDIAKHRADVFRIAATLPGEPGPGLPSTIQRDLKVFLAEFPTDSPEWPAILDSLKTTFPNIKLKPVDLVNSIRTYFRVA